MFMILLPLGFGSRLPTFPVMTLIITALICIVSIPYFKNLDEIDQAQVQASEKVHLDEKLQALAVEACGSQKLEAKDCDEVVQIFKLRNAKESHAELEKSLEAYAKETDVDTLNRVVDFVKKLSDDPKTFGDEIKTAKAFAPVEEAYQEITDTTKQIYKRHYFFTKATRGFAQLMLAQWTHGGWAHLLGNLFFFLAFGVVLEARMGAVMFLAVYLMGGTLGMLAEYPHLGQGPLLGASANISAVIGAFFVFYARKPMKVLASLIFYNKIVDCPTWAMVLVFILCHDIAGAASASDGVAHIAHLTGFTVGAFAAYLIKSNDGLADDYLFPVEYDWHVQMRAFKLIGEKLRLAEQILKYNPMNALVLNEALRVILQSEFKMVPEAKEFVEKYFSRSVRIALRKRDEQTMRFNFDQFPEGMSLIECLKEMPPRELLALSERELKSGHWISAMRISDAFRFYNPKSRGAAKFEQTMRNMLQHLQTQKTDLSALEAYKTMEPRTTYEKLLQDYNLRGTYERAS